MSLLADFQDIVKQAEPLAPHTYFRLGGPAEFFARPTGYDQLAQLLQRCREDEIPFRILGGGCNILVPDDGVKGLVIKIEQGQFADTAFSGSIFTSGAGVPLSTAITQTTTRSLAGLDVLVGIPGTVGGAIRTNAGGRSGDTGQTVSEVTVMNQAGEISVRSGDEVQFSYRSTNLSGMVVLEAKFELEEDDPQAITNRMRKIWIAKKASQPLSFQSAGCIFKNPKGLNCGLIIEQAGLKGTKVGGAEVSERHANFIVANSDCSSRDVIRLIELIRTKVAERFAVELDLEIQVW